MTDKPHCSKTAEVFRTCRVSGLWLAMFPGPAQL